MTEGTHMTDTNEPDLGPVEKRNVSMWPEQWQIVDDISRRYGLGSVSTALRFIVTDYRRMLDELVAAREASRK